MEMQQIRHFVAVARHGSLRRAAAELHITQPALTRSIRHLEERLQSSLLTRTARGVLPTPAGEVFLEFAVQTLNENARVLNRLRQLRGATPGELRIGIAANFAHPALPAALVDLARAMPERRITVREQFLAELVTRLAQSELDMVVALIPEDFSHPELVVTPLVTIAGGIVCCAQHPLASRRPVSLAELADVPWIMSGLEENERYLERRFSAHGVTAPRIAMRTSSPLLLPRLLRGSPFVSLLPLELVAPDLAAGTLSRVDTPLGDFLAQGAVIHQKRLGGLLDIEDFARRFGTASRELARQARPRRSAVLGLAPPPPATPALAR